MSALPLSKPEEKKQSLFERCRAIDCSKIIRTNYQGAKYVSWADMWQLLHTEFKDLYIQFKEFSGMPYLKTELGYFVGCAILIEGHSKELLLPVMDGAGKAIENPDARDISDNRMRCFVKCCALHGLGLECWEKDDLLVKQPSHGEKTITASTKITSQSSHPSTELRASFGKHKGKTVAEIPPSYFDWLIKDAESKGKTLEGDALNLYKAFRLHHSMKEILPMEEDGPPPIEEQWSQ